MRFVECDETPAELLLEHIWQEENRRLHLDAGETIRWGQLLQVAKEGRGIAAVLGKWDDVHHPQGWVQDDPEAARRDPRVAGLGVFGNGTIKSAYSPVRVPEEPDAWEILVYPTLSLVARIKTDAEEAEPDIVEIVSVLE